MPERSDLVHSMTPINDSIHRHWPPEKWIGSPSILGVSGGPDSVALLHAIWRISNEGAKLIVAHIDHGLRGAESDADREFVCELAKRWKLPCEIVRLAELDEVSATASEETLRKARHRHLRRIADKHHAAWIATAHHADDVVETLLHRLLRGSGPRGLASIAPTRILSQNLSLVHPLLSATRADVMTYVEQHGLPYRIDQSNTSERYTRNRIRMQLLPFLREFAGSSRLDQRLWQSAQQVRELQEFVERAGRDWFENSSVSEIPGGVEFRIAAFEDVQWCVIREGFVQLWHTQRWPLQEMNAQHWARLADLLKPATTSKHPRRLQLPGGIFVTMRRGMIRFTREVPADT